MLHSRAGRCGLLGRELQQHAFSPVSRPQGTNTHLCHASRRRSIQTQATLLPELQTVIQHQLLPLYDMADSATAAAASSSSSSGGWLAPLTDGLEGVLKYLQNGLDKLHVPYSYGWSIVFLTAIVKVATFPLTKQQVNTVAITSQHPCIAYL